MPHPSRRGSLALLLVLPLLALLPPALLVEGCADTPAAQSQPVALDAGASSSCTLGTRGCGCTTAGGCDPGLLCSAGRCYDTEGSKDEPADPNLRPPTPAPVIQPADEPPDASTDSGPSSNG